jgi:hypothetical protein
MAYDFGEEEGGCVEEEIAVVRCGDGRGPGWAPLGDGGEMDAGERRSGLLHEAMMRTVTAAAGGEVSSGGGCEGKRGRDQREAEEKKKREADQAAHTVIVAEGFKKAVRDLLGRVAGQDDATVDFSASLRNDRWKNRQRQRQMRGFFPLRFARGSE